MSDRIFMPLMALIAMAMIALALVWPQGYGARSPDPFGSTPIQQTPEMRAKIEREKEGARRRAEEAVRAVKAAGGTVQ
ncbi:hypothetical protein ACN2C7_13325 [Caulobacter sp. ErkDOM-E]|uniref:hypothetical protein n=1 Tax=Caulobacter sp. ErkDOM-E TaxID=3402778 RepID=UPI003AF5568E